MLFHLDTRELRGKVVSLRAELATSEEQLRQQLVMRGPAGDTLERQNRITRLKEELAAAELAISKATITAPIDGTVTALEIQHPGAMVRAGQQLAAIAPSGARLIVEAQVPNARIGFVEKGLPVKIKLDAFPFQDYGSISGTVMEVSPDARTKDQQGSFYRVLIAPSQTTMVNRGKVLKLRPGLALTAEIVTERKSVLDLLLEPIRKLRAQVVNLG
jgi:HlyD family secretion protein